MTDQLRRMVAEAMESDRPLLINPTENEIRLTAESMRREGRLICTGCRRAIGEERYETRRISFGPRLQALAHLHLDCATEFGVRMHRERHLMADL